MGTSDSRDHCKVKMTMRYRTCIFLLLAIATNFVCAAEAGQENVGEPLDGGFGTNVTWWTLDEGLDECNRTAKPMMMIIHKTWCPACDVLKGCFKNSSLIQELSQFFVMVNLMDQEVPDTEALAPDGHYFPSKSVEVSMAKAIRLFYNIVEEKGHEL